MSIGNSKNGEVFVVDDDPMVLNALSVFLSREGYQVAGFSEGASFLDAAKSRTPLCIILDVHMPGQTGLDILKELNAQQYPAPIFIVSGSGDIPMAVEAIKHGAFDFIEKPVKASTVVTRVREAVEAYCRSRPLGFLPSNEKIALPSRHLGLTMAREALAAECLDEMVSWVESHVDLEALLSLAREHSHGVAISPLPQTRCCGSKVRIGLACDSAFCFYYQDNLDLLADQGAETLPFSPLRDTYLPEGAGALYFGGGFPEVFAAQLATNQSMLAAVQSLLARARTGTRKPQRSGFFRREKRSESKPIEGCSNGASTAGARGAGRSFVTGSLGASRFDVAPRQRSSTAPTKCMS